MIASRRTSVEYPGGRYRERSSESGAATARSAITVAEAEMRGVAVAIGEDM